MCKLKEKCRMERERGRERVSEKKAKRKKIFFVVLQTAGKCRPSN